MLSRLFGPRGSAPDDEVIYAIGDIHGRDDLLARLHQRIEADLEAAAPGLAVKVIYLGDYIDRGPDSRAVIERLLRQPVRGARSIFLKGNHEDAMLRFLNAEAGGENWLTIGGGATVMSYGVSLRGEDNRALPAETVRQQLAAALPADHLAFLRDLELTHDAGDYLFVHAGVKPGRPLEEQDPKDLLWIRREFLKSRRNHGKIVVHGHSSGSDIVQKANRICIDTTAYATDRLSCVILHGSERRFINAEL